MRLRNLSGRNVLTTLALASAVTVGACDTLKNNLLEATDPDVIDPSSVQSSAGAVALRNGALARLRTATSGGESTWLFGGLLVDEYATSSTFVQNDETDQRSIQLNNSIVNSMLRQLYRVRTSANQAIDLLTTYRADPDEDIGEMYFARGYAELQLASDYCNGIPLSNGVTNELGNPLTVDSVFKAAVASFDAAITHSAGTGANAVLINRAARIGKARALLAISLSNAPAAAALVSNIPTSFRYNVTSSLTTDANTLWDQPISSNRYIVGDSIQKNDRSITVKNAIPFFSAHDPRVPAHYKIASNKRDTVKAQDGGTYVIEADTLFGQTSPVALTSGIDARLIEAEAALAANNPGAMMGFLNALRQSPQVLTPPSPQANGTHPGLTTPVMAPLVDPVDPTARVDLLFREKAFWTFSRGQRLGDLRRLIREYGRAADGSNTGGYPVGDHFKGGQFGVDLQLPVTTSEQIGNPNFTACFDRKA
jgi:hypothetical protein